MSSASRARSLPERRLRSRIHSRWITLLLGTGALAVAAPVQAQQAGYGQTLGTTPMEQQIYDGGTGKPSSGSILDSTNPLDLLNKLRRGTAMEDATPPSSAIDQALQQLDAQSAPAPAAGQGQQGPSSAVTPKATSPLWTVQGTPPAPQSQVSPLRQAP